MAERQPQRGRRDTSRVFRLLLLVSLVLHLPITPLALLFGLAQFLSAPEKPPLPPEEQLNEIPISLLTDLEGLEAPASPEAAAGELPNISDAVVDQIIEQAEKSAEKLADAGTHEDAGKKASDPERPDAAAADAGVLDAASDARANDAGSDAMPADAAADAQGAVAENKVEPQLADPLALGGAAAKVADSNANVRLILYNEQIRKHPIGHDVGRILGSLYQWRDFFGPSAIDPILDIDRMLLAGPQFRDSSNVVAVLRYNVTRARMHQAIDAIVQRGRPAGRWLDGPIPTALARADRAERLFIMPSAAHVVVAPPSVRNSKALGPRLSIPKAPGSEVAVAYVVTPSRVFRGLPIDVEVPESIAWVRARVWLNADGGAEASFQAEDASPELALEHARSLQDQLRNATQMRLPLLGIVSFVKDIRFQAQGTAISGTITMTRNQLQDALGLVVAFLDEYQPSRKPPREPKGTGPTGSTAPAGPRGVPAPAAGGQGGRLGAGSPR